MQALVTGPAKRAGRAIALELHRAGARVAVHYRDSRQEAEETAGMLGVAPGVVLLPEGVDADRLAKRIPLGRIGSPEDVARAVLFLAKELFITGEILTVDGGRSLNP